MCIFKLQEGFGIEREKRVADRRVEGDREGERGGPVYYSIAVCTLSEGSCSRRRCILGVRSLPDQRSNACIMSARIRLMISPSCFVPTIKCYNNFVYNESPGEKCCRIDWLPPR